MEPPEHPSRESDLIWTVMSGTALATGADFFPALVRHLAGALGVQHAFIAQCTDLRKSRVRTLAFWSGQSLADNVEYDLAGTPCEAVIGGATAVHRDDVQARFPQDRDLATLGARGYLGLPLVAASGEVLGHLAVLDAAPLREDEVTVAVLRTFAARASMELERLRASHEIAALNEKLQRAADRARTLLA